MGSSEDARYLVEVAHDIGTVSDLDAKLDVANACWRSRMSAFPYHDPSVPRGR